MRLLPALSLGLALTFGVVAVAPQADAASCATNQRHKANRDALYGAVAGGLLGNAVSHGGGKTGGTLLGAGAGAVVGHQIGKHRVSCSGRSYYYSHGKRHYYRR
jgi:outer membrane lipoprotein SlyB